MKKLAEIQKELKAPKNQFNKFGEYNYRNLEDILEALKPLLGEDDVFYLSDEVMHVGNFNYIKASAYFNGVTVNGFAREAIEKKKFDDSQLTGSASSYARKYALNGLFAIDDTKDADSQDNTKKETTNAYDGNPKDAGFKNAAEVKRVYAEKLEKLKSIDTISRWLKAEKLISEFVEQLAKFDSQSAISFQEEVDKKRREIGADDGFIDDEVPNFA